MSGAMLRRLRIAQFSLRKGITKNRRYVQGAELVSTVVKRLSRMNKSIVSQLFVTVRQKGARTRYGHSNGVTQSKNEKQRRAPSHTNNINKTCFRLCLDFFLPFPCVWMIRERTTPTHTHTRTHTHDRVDRRCR